jgi:hypothetical protein
MSLTTFDLSGFLAVPSSLKLLYQNDWSIFERVQIYNINVSTLRNAGQKTTPYYQYVTFEERNSFINGRLLHIKRYPTADWSEVPQD